MVVIYKCNCGSLVGVFIEDPPGYTYVVELQWLQRKTTIDWESEENGC